MNARRLRQRCGGLERAIRVLALVSVSALVTAAAGAGCMDTSTAECSWGIVCPPSKACSEARLACVPRSQYEPCEGRPDLSACTYPGASGLQQCVQDLCEPGSSWVTTDTGSSYAVSQLWGSSETDVFAASPDGIRHFDGQAWSSMVLDATNLLYTNVWGTAPDDVFAVGEWNDAAAVDIFHYDGSAWSRMATLDGVWNVTRFWGSSSTDVYAACNCNDDYFDCSGLYRYDGASWSAVELGDDYDLKGIWGSSATDIYAIGPDRRVLHYDGLSWQVHVITTYTVSFSAIAGRSASDVYVLGNNSEFTHLYHFDGSEWSLIFADDITPPSVSFGSSLDVFWTAPGQDVFIGGESTFMARYFNGAFWPMSVSDTVIRIRAIWGDGVSLFAGGDSGIVFRFTEPTL
ncbi:MAG: hypothetical protein ABI333_28865 [bacterium]